MAVPDRSIDPRILESAKAEFLEKGFEGASLKTICEGAGITTGALYKRYRGKEELFHAVVAETMTDIEAFVEQRTLVKAEQLTDRELLDCWNMHSGEMEDWFRFMYDRREGFYLLLARAEGTRYTNFKHDWVTRMALETRDFILEAQKRGLMDPIPPEELHALFSAYWEAMFEPMVHGFSWAQIQAHCRRLCGFFDWHRAMGLADPS